MSLSDSKDHLVLQQLCRMPATQGIPGMPLCSIKITSQHGPGHPGDTSPEPRCPGSEYRESHRFPDNTGEFHSALAPG